MSPQTIIVIGRSGSGKGTQVGLLQEFLRNKNAQIQSIHVETGQYFRDFIDDTTVSAQLAKEIYLQGKKQPDFLAISMWGYVLCKDYTGVEHILFDGVPRSLAQAHVFEDALSFYNRFDATFEKPKVIYLDVSHDWSVQRIHERGRIDDQTDEQVEVRMHWFDTDVIAAIDFFKENSKFDFIHIQGEKTVEEVHADIVSHFA
jgi:adenylate kinase family enzyme